MDIVNSMLLVVSIMVVSTLIAYFVQKETPTTKEFNDKIAENLMEEFESKESSLDEEVVKQAEVEKPKKKENTTLKNQKLKNNLKYQNERVKK